MPGTFGEKIKAFLQRIGKGSQRLSQMGRTRIELMEARSKLEGRYTALGKALAARVIDRQETVLDASEEAIASFVEEVKEARKRVAEVEGKLQQIRESGEEG